MFEFLKKLWQGYAKSFSADYSKMFNLDPDEEITKSWMAYYVINPTVGEVATHAVLGVETVGAGVCVMPTNKNRICFMKQAHDGENYSFRKEDIESIKDVGDAKEKIRVGAASSEDARLLEIKPKNGDVITLRIPTSAVEVLTKIV